MRIITFNANGIRSAASKGFFDWLPPQKADVVCIQETKAQLHQLEHDPQFCPAGYHCFYEDATAKKGYAGVALFSRREPDTVLRGLGVAEFDAEGRYIEARFGKLSVVSLYLPSGSSGPHRQASKDRFLEFFLPVLKQWAKSGRDYVVCGDWNIAHTQKDLKNWKSNQKNSGFLPHERAWMDKLFGEAGWVDAYRVLHPDATDACYTWWSNRGQARAKNVGWRIDYQVVTPSLKDKVRAARIYKDKWFSDHAPLIMDYAHDL
jgi:exodeoxyribonuclease III